MIFSARIAPSDEAGTGFGTAEGRALTCSSICGRGSMEIPRTAVTPPGAAVVGCSGFENAA